ncbi:uncharacterized protein MYCFIDRAFT_180713 [Pseudocercospora fijiensis CIRAD86]|uniref:Uncharacterized protein n=1 Tax=Pseudocercospora fijiensis (strain CIRAD86) TaxID=383855 RepID=M3AH38_PSEFD|nr:uncharacterized protein MYCFIDRAFT_180713 [Pseudocercospora fijiensis CIRAD86]EME76807.1 hypothetical protein MYCFIDRAFT_180713 [Pseudocercospora fijiensis CIRAD86]
MLANVANPILSDIYPVEKSCPPLINTTLAHPPHANAQLFPNAGVNETTVAVSEECRSQTMAILNLRPLETFSLRHCAAPRRLHHVSPYGSGLNLQGLTRSPGRPANKDIHCTRQCPNTFASTPPPPRRHPPPKYRAYAIHTCRPTSVRWRFTAEFHTLSRKSHPGAFIMRPIMNFMRNAAQKRVMNAMRKLAAGHRVPHISWLIFAITFWFFGTSDNSRLAIFANIVCMLCIFYMLLLIVCSLLFFRGHSASYQARHRTSLHLVISGALTAIGCSLTLVILIAILSPGPGLPGSSHFVKDWNQFLNDTATVRDYSGAELPNIYNHAATGAYKGLVAACRLRPGMTEMIEWPWDSVSRIHPKFELDKTRTEWGCWKPAENESIHDSHLGSDFDEEEGRFRRKAVDFAVHMTGFTKAVKNVEDSINKTISVLLSHGVYTALNSVRHNLGSHITHSGEPASTYLWKYRLVAFYSPVIQHTPWSELNWRFRLRIQISTITRPVFSILRAMFFSSPTLEEELYNALGDQYFDSNYYTKRTDLTFHFKQIEHFRDAATGDYNELMSLSFAKIHRRHPDFAGQFSAVRRLLKEPGTEEGSHYENFQNLKTAAMAGDSSGVTDVAPFQDVALTEWWKPVLEKMIRVNILQRIDQFGKGVEQLRREGRTLSAEDIKGLLLEGSQEFLLLPDLLPDDEEPPTHSTGSRYAIPIILMLAFSGYYVCALPSA